MANNLQKWDNYYLRWATVAVTGDLAIPDCQAKLLIYKEIIYKCLIGKDLAENLSKFLLLKDHLQGGAISSDVPRGTLQDTRQPPNAPRGILAPK